MTTLVSNSNITKNPQSTSSSVDYSSLRNSIKKVLYFGAGVPASSVAVKIASFIGNIDYNQCMALPAPVYNYARTMCRIEHFLPVFTDNFSFTTIKAPIIEELIFRLGLQETILKEIPRQILNRFSPSSSSAVDSKVAKVARVMFSALAFSLIHANPPEIGWPSCSVARIINNFATGLILGTIQETTGSPIWGILFHAGFNLRSAVVMSKYGLKFTCNF